jgi:hypothetical protein
MKTTYNYEQIVRSNADLLIQDLRRNILLTIESSSGFALLRDTAKGLNTPFAVKDALDGISNALRVHLGTVSQSGLGQVFITFKKSRLISLANDLPSSIWALTQQRTPNSVPSLGFLGEIMRLGSDLDCVANVDWREGKVNRVSFVSAGYRKPESVFLQETTKDALAVSSDGWSIEKGDLY